MNRPRPYADITLIDDHTVALHYFEGNDNESGCTWQMPIQEARDLARWWRMEIPRVKNGQTPLNNLRTGGILVSMFAPTPIHVCGFDIHGRVRPVGYSLAHDVVEYLTTWPPEHEPE
jgi:hypothetical protein